MKSMRYNLDTLPLSELLLPMASAGDAVARLDDRISQSPLGAGWIERSHFADTVASLYLDGALVHLEDLVLHDAHMDIRAPTHDLVLAHGVLRARRQILSNPANWALSHQGLAALRGRPADAAMAPERGDAGGKRPATPLPQPVDAEDAFAAELAAIDAVLARSAAALDGAYRGGAQQAARQSGRDLGLYDEDWNEDARLAEWLDVARAGEGLPPVLRAAVLLDAWNTLDVLQHNSWIGRLLAAAALRESGTLSASLLAINSGLRDIRWERRRARDRKTRLLAWLEGIERAGRIGLAEHDRLSSARQGLERKLVGRRSNSKLPQLIDLVLSRPLVSAGMIARQLNVTQQGAVVLAESLSLREMTGRGRYRAWGVL